MAERTRSSSRQAALEADLFAAAAAGDASTVQQLLHKGASANAASGGGVTPLHAAAKAGHGRVVQVLLAAGAEVNAVTDEGITPLAQAACVGACRGCPGVIKQLVRAGAVLGLNLPDGASSTVLHAAAADGQLPALQALLDAGCDPSLLDAYSRTPLWYAVEHCQLAAAAKLIRAGAALNNIDLQQFPLPAAQNPSDGLRSCCQEPSSFPLVHAACTGSEPMVRLLIKKGANVSWALFCLAVLQATAEAEAAHAAAAAAAAQLGVQRQAPTQASRMLQQWAAALPLLLHVAGSINVSDMFGFTALHIAAMLGDVGPVDVLLRHGAAVNTVTEASPGFPNGSTPLEVAAAAAGSECLTGTDGTARQQAYAAAMRRLLAAGAAATGLSAISVASAGLDDVLQLMLRQGFDINTTSSNGITVLHAALTCGLSTDTLRQVLAAGADVSATTCHGLTALHAAVWQARADCAQLLLEAGAEVDAKAAGLVGNCTPMHQVAITKVFETGGPISTQTVGSSTPVELTPEQQHAALEALKRTLQVLLDHGVDINAVSGDDRTPLQAAICVRNVLAVQALLEAGADPSATTEAAFVPVVLAVQTRQADMLRLLLQHKVPVNQLYSYCDDDMTLLALAVHCRSPAMVEVLLQFGADIDVSSAAMELPLSSAIRQGQYDIVQQLLAAGANVHAQSERWLCPLMSAIDSRNPRMLRMLLQAGADPHAEMTVRGSAGISPLKLAATTGHMGVVHELLVATDAHRASWELVYPAVVAAVPLGYAGVTRQLLAVHPPVQPISCLQTILHQCWQQGQGRKHQDTSAQLCLQVYKKARWLSDTDDDTFDPSSAIAEVTDGLQGLGTPVDRAAASLALLRGWSADVSAAEADHRALSVQEQHVALGRVGVQHLLLLVAAAHKAHVSRRPAAAGCVDEAATASADRRVLPWQLRKKHRH